LAAAADPYGPALKPLAMQDVRTVRVETDFLILPAMIARAGQPIVSRAPQQRAERAQDAMRRCLDHKILQPATRAAERRKTERKSRQGCCKKSIGFESDACLPAARNLQLLARLPFARVAAEQRPNDNGANGDADRHSVEHAEAVRASRHCGRPYKCPVPEQKAVKRRTVGLANDLDAKSGDTPATSHCCQGAVQLATRRRSEISLPSSLFTAKVPAPLVASAMPANTTSLQFGPKVMPSTVAAASPSCIFVTSDQQLRPGRCSAQRCLSGDVRTLSPITRIIA
jgi:hypothetical protein